MGSNGYSRSPNGRLVANVNGHFGGPQSLGQILERLKADFPGMPEKTLATAVRTRKTYEDSLRWLRQMQQRNLMPPNQPQAPVDKRQTIRQKFSHLAYDQSSQMQMNQMQVQQMHAMAPLSHPINQMQVQMQMQHMQMQHMSPMQMNPMHQMSPMQMQMRPKVPARRPALDEEESEDDMSDSDNYDPQEAAEFDSRVLEFLNTASAEAIADVAAQPMESVQALVKKRPFATLAQAAKVDVVSEKEQEAAVAPNGKRRRGAARKPAGSKIIDAARNTLRGYEAVDSLIKECSRLGKLVQRGISEWQLDEDTLKAKGGSFFPEQPKMLSEGTELKNYQQVGINWLSLLYKDKLSCILADEMGLGKTLQVIAFLAHLKELSEPGPHLVVCPASTLENWLREFTRFCPQMRIEAYYGGQNERHEIRESIEAAPGSFDVMVTTYNLATGHKADTGFLKSMGFNVVVYDEGHLLKNSQSERYNKLMKLRANFRVLLTGTPLQNNLRELISLLSFILPRLFTENRDDLLEVFKFKAKATTDESEKSKDDLLSEQRIKKAKTMMQPFVMRRRKEQVLAHLPPKTHEVLKCEMTERQREIYAEQMKRNKHGLKSAKDQVDEQQSLKKKEQREAGKQLDNVLMQLRKAALHPLLFRQLYSDKKLRQMAKAIMNEEVYKKANETYIFEDMQVMNDFELDRLCRQFPVTLGEYLLEDSKYHESGKIRALVKLLEEAVKKGDRILLFSQFTQMLDIIQRVLDLMGIKYLRMDGQTPVEARQDMIDQYHEKEELKVFLLSTKAGGFGINLAVANVVVVFDLSFNPHDDKQAEDRAHRVGQTRPVHVYRMITQDTIEENILDLANTKLALDKQVSEDTKDGDEEDEIDTEKEAYIAGQLLGINHSGAAPDEDSDDDESDDEGPAPKRQRTKTAPKEEHENDKHEDDEHEDDDNDDEAEDDDFEGSDDEEVKPKTPRRTRRARA